MNILLQTIPVDQLDRVLKITPEGLGGYGLALAVLIVMSWVFHKNWQKAEAESKVQGEKMLEFMTNATTLFTRISLRLDDGKDDPGLKKEILRTVRENNEILKNFHERKN